MTAIAGTVHSSELRELLDQQQIRDLLARFSLLCDGRTDSSFVREVYTEDGIDDHGLFGKVFQGWAELEDMFDQSSNHLDAVAHFTSNELIQVSGDTATGLTYVQCYTWLRESGHLGNVRPADYVFVGVYDDVFARTPAGWRIKRRLMKPLGTGALGTGAPNETYFASYRRDAAAAAKPSEA